MLALALVLLALIALLVVASFAGSSEEVVIEFLNVTVTSSVGGVFVAGVITGLVALASVAVVKVSWRQIRRRNQEVHELRRRADQAAAPVAPPEPAAAESEGPVTEPAEPSAESPVDAVADGSDSTSETPRP
jgi:uncharacterized membrane protein